MKPVHEPAGKTPRAISERTEALSLGRAPVCTASHETPTNRAIAIAPMIASVVAALRAFGGRKAPTPFEIASTPVSAAAPEANARRTTTRLTAPMPAGTGSGTTARGHVPVAHVPAPT